MLIDTVTEEVRKLFDKYTRTKVAEPVLALSPNGATIAWVSDDETICLQDAMTNKISHGLTNPDLFVEKLIFSPDGQLLAAIHRESAISIWRTTTGERRFCFSGRYMDSIAFSPNCRLFALVDSQHRGVVELWDMDVYQAGMDGCSSDTSLGTAEKHRLIVSQDQKQERTKAIKAIIFSTDGRTIASTSSDNCVCIWDSVTGSEIRELRHQDLVNKIFYSADSKSIVSLSGSNTILIWDMSSNGRRQLAHQGRNIESIALSPDGQTLASVALDSIQIWDLPTGQRRQYLQHHVEDLIPSAALFFARTGNLARAEFSPNSKMLAAAGLGVNIHVWEVATGKEIQRLQGDSNLIMPITPLAFSSDSKTLSALADLSERKRKALATRQALIWDVETGIKSWLPPHPGANYSNIALSSDGQAVAASIQHGGSILIMQDTHSREIHPIGRFETMSFSADDRYLETNRGRLKIDGQEPHTTPFVGSDWVWHGGRRVLWIPPSHRGFVCACYGNKFALGFESGRLLFLRFDS
ncbi:WD40-repeat-containing domain protein, partial [Aspergillus pseudodeflectus]